MKCPNWKKAACSVDFTDKGYEKYKNVRKPCPKGVNDKCEIVPKMKRVRAWAFQYRDRNGLLKWYANELKTTMPVKNVPCWIVYKDTKK